jgi:hypothetical protein
MLGDAGKVLQMEVLVRHVRQQDRIIAPDDSIRAYAVGKLAEGGDGFIEAW